MSDERRDEQMGLPGWLRAFGLAEVVALAVSLLWVVACVVYFLGAGGPGFVMSLAVIVVPVAVIWLAASAARASRITQDDGRRIEEGLTAMRHSFVEAQRVQALGGYRPEEPVRKLEDHATTQRQTVDAPAVFASKRPHGEEHMQAPERSMRDVSPTVVVADAATPADEQPSFELGTPAGAGEAPAEIEDLIRAINFPEDADDEAGFEALRRALADRRIATLIQAAQDVLTLLSQDGIYMDDLKPDLARPEIWRQFAGGERGRPVAALGGIRDRSSLALTAGRMRSDAIFRDASLHFLRRFDDVLAEVEPRLNDEQMSRFGATRTARAFMLLGRVTGTFD